MTGGSPAKYLVFAYHTYYPGGGWRDLYAVTDLEGARAVRDKLQPKNGPWLYDDVEVVSLETLEEVQL